MKKLLLFICCSVCYSLINAQPITLVKVGPSEDKPFVYEKYSIRKMKIKYDDMTYMGTLFIETNDMKDIEFSLDSVVGYINEETRKTYRIYEDHKFEVIDGRLECSFIGFSETTGTDDFGKTKKEYVFALSPSMTPVANQKENIVKWIFDDNEDKFKEFKHAHHMSEFDIVHENISKRCHS